MCFGKRLTNDEEGWIALGQEYLELRTWIQDELPEGYEILEAFDNGETEFLDRGKKELNAT